MSALLSGLLFASGALIGIPPAPAVSISDAQVDEAAGVAEFTVALSRSSASRISVAYATSNLTASSGHDYTAVAATAFFLPNETTARVLVPIVEDVVDEPSEAFQVTLSQPSGALIADPSGTASIADNDRDGRFSCRATALELAGMTAARANANDAPCKDDRRLVGTTMVSAGVVSVTVETQYVETDQRPDLLLTTPADDDRARAAATVQKTRVIVAGTAIEIGPVQSEATVTCAAGVPMFAGSSFVSSLKIGDLPVAVGTETLTIPLPFGAGTVRLNTTSATTTALTRRAVVVETPVADAVIGAAKVNYEGTDVHPAGTPCVNAGPGGTGG